MSNKEKYKAEILDLNTQIDELEKRKHYLERLIGEHTPSTSEEYRQLSTCWDSQSKVFLESIQRCIEEVDDIKKKVLDNYRVEVTPHSYTQRGSDNYLVCWKNIESHSFWEDDQYLNLPKVKIELSSYREREEERWVNPDYPTHETQVKVAKDLELKYKQEISDFFDTQYNKDEHLKYLIEKCLNRFSESSTWDYQILHPVLNHYDFMKIYEIVCSMVPKNCNFLVKRLLINLLIEKIKG